MKLELTGPFKISARLMASVTIGNAVLSLGYGKVTADRRMEYEVYIDLPGNRKGYKTKDLQSGVGGGSIQAGFVSLLAFLAAAGESYGGRMRRHEKTPGENEGGFHKKVVEWAYQNSDEISMLLNEIEETPGQIVEKH